MQPEVVIVGAGAAGVGAGLELQAMGVPFVIVEAGARIGGRAFTDRTSLPEPWDRGCAWLHCADVNPLTAWAKRLGADVETSDRTDRTALWVGGAWLDAPEARAINGDIDAAFAAIYAAAGAAPDAPDGALSDVIAREGPGARIIRNIARLMASEDPEKVSVRGYGDYADTGVNLIVRSGYGDLIERMAAGLPIRLNTPVTHVGARRGGVFVQTGAGRIEARAALVTVSSNVLLSGAIAIDPGPARDLLDLVHHVPCGAYEKVAIALRRLPVDPGDTLFFWVDPGAGAMPMNFQLAPSGRPVMIAHLGGQDARDMAQAGAEAMVALATERLVAAFGAEIRREIVASAVTGWQADPLVRGAYSYARPGEAAARHAMIAADTGEIGFAGEAFSAQWYATAHGAYQSGRDAARRLAARFVAV